MMQPFQAIAQAESVHFPTPTFTTLLQLVIKTVANVWIFFIQ